MPVSEWTTKRGLRPRAFMGWKKFIVSGVGGNADNAGHTLFVGEFFDKWAEAGVTCRLTGAINEAVQGTTILATEVVLYGTPYLVLRTISSLFRPSNLTIES